MKKLIFLFMIFLYFITGISFSFGLDGVKNTFLSITLNYDLGNITLERINSIQSIDELNKFISIGSYTLKVFSFEEEILYETKFDFSLEMFGVPPKEWFDVEGNQIYFPNITETSKGVLEKSSEVLFIPYYKNAKYVNVYEGGVLKLEIDLSEHAICNENNICDHKETNELCPSECLCGNNICDVDESYSTCSKDCPYEHSERKEMNFWQRILSFIKSAFK